MIGGVGQGASVTVQVTVGQDRAHGRIKGGSSGKGVAHACENIVEGRSTRAEERQAARWSWSKVTLRNQPGAGREKMGWPSTCGVEGGRGVGTGGIAGGIGLSQGSAIERGTPGKR